MLPKQFLAHPVRWRDVSVLTKLQARVYDILPSTTAVFSYAIGSPPQKNCQLTSSFLFCFVFVGAQTVVSLFQTTQIISDICFITDHHCRLRWLRLTAKTTENHLNRLDGTYASSPLPAVRAPHVYVRAWALGYFYSH